MHTDKNGFKGACFLHEQISGILAQTHLAHFHLPVQAEIENVHGRTPLLHHSFLIFITILAAHMRIRSGAHWPWDFRTTSTPLPESKAPSWGLLHTQNFLLRLLHKILIPSTKSKVRKNRGETTIKNTLKISQPHNSTICRLNSKFWPSKLNSILLKQFFPSFLSPLDTDKQHDCARARCKKSYQTSEAPKCK